MTLIYSEWSKALGWTLVHTLWEGAAIALALVVVLGLARSSRVRYAAACLAMLALLTGFAVTVYWLRPQIRFHAADLKLPRPVSPSLDDLPAASDRGPWDVSELLPWLAPLWLAGIFLSQLRCLISWTAAERLRRIGVCGPPDEWIDRLGGLRARLQMTRPVTLLESCFAEVPVVIGHLRPVILMPLGLLAGLPVGQIEAILLHELAHIRRADYLVNLMQAVVEGLLFYHPAVWWISRVIRAEREHCCDDLVVLTNGDAHEYAMALTALAENRGIMRDAALAATGGNLVKRIRRLLSPPDAPRSAIAPILAVGVLILSGAAALAAWQSPALPLLAAQAGPSAPVASRYDKWLHEEVVYIITDQERADFKKLQTDAARDQFMEQFWKRRDPTPDTPENEFKDEHYRRIAFVNNRFPDSKLPGWKTDRGRIYIQYGPPDEIDSHPAGGKYTRPPEEGGTQAVTYPFEQWRYRYIEGIGKNVILEFVDKAKTGEYRLTTDPAEKNVASSRQPAIGLNYAELAAIVDGGAGEYDRLPLKVRVSYAPLTSSVVLTQITVQFDTKDLHFEEKDGISSATVNIYGRVSTLARRPLSPFEDVVSVRQSTETLHKLMEANIPQVFQKTLPLQPGRYRLNIVAKDVGARNPGTYEMILDVPQGGH